MHTAVFRVLEVVVYTILNSIPYHFCVLYIFQDRLRFSLPKTILIMIPPTLLELGLNLMTIFCPMESTFLLNLLWSAGYILAYCLAVKTPIGKIGFVMLVLLNLNNFNIVASKYLEGLFFSSTAMERFHFANSLTMVLTEAVIMVPCFLNFKRRYRPAIQQESNDFLWKYLWLVPATFYFLWHYHVHFNDVSSLEVATDVHSLFFLTVVNGGAYLIYYLVLRMVNETAENNQLRASNHQLALQSLQYENLQDRIAETRKANHDLRHHITVMQGYLEAGNYESLQQYFRTLKAQTPGGNLHYCQHSTLNMLLAYFSQMAREQDIDCSIRVHVPQALSIADNDLAVLMGNLVENAVDACAAQAQGARKLQICGNVQGNRLLFTIDNTYSHTLRQDRTGLYMSTKHPGRGIGLESVRAIVQRHGGTLQIEQKDGMFCVSVFLML